MFLPPLQTVRNRQELQKHMKLLTAIAEWFPAELQGTEPEKTK
jgi:hypothetical protein